MSELDARQSELIKAMRFPLIVLVLFEHSVGADLAPMRRSLDGANIFHFTTELISRHFCSIAVCWFFVLSGFLFFRNLKEGEAGKGWFVDKWKRRTHTLLIPHLFWNLFYVLVILAVTWLFRLAGIAASADMMYSVKQGPLFWFVTGPADYPLWYLRDLIAATVLAPALYFVIKKAPRLSLLLLAALYLCTFFVKGTLFQAVSFFGVGAGMGIHHTNMLGLCRKVRYPAAVLTVALAVLATCRYGHETHQLFRLLFFPFGMITFLNVCDLLIRRPRTKERMIRLSETVFFIYAAHEIYILGWTKGLFLRLFGAQLASRWAAYFVVPVVVLLICLALFYLLKKLTPRTLAFACGGRVQTDKA